MSYHLTLVRMAKTKQKQQQQKPQEMAFQSLCMSKTEVQT